jgi:cholesterol oxidase
MDRRGFVKGAGVAAAAMGLVGARQAGPARADPGTVAAPDTSAKVSQYRQLVPEIFAPLPDAPQHVTAIVVGSGFGASITALRLAQAGMPVAVLERGSRWPNDPWRDIFVADTLPDGRGFWHRSYFTGMTRIPVPVDPFGGVLAVDSFPNMDVWHGACVGGGSVVYSGVMIEPERRFFEHVFRGVVGYDEMHQTYYPRVRQMLRLSPMPADIYNSTAFAHSRAWDQQVIAAGYTPQRVDGIWNWNVVRDELHGRSRPSATVGCTDLGNSNGAKFDLNQNYLRYAEDTGRARIYPGHRVEAIGVERDGRYAVSVTKLAPTGDVLSARTITCDKLFLGAGSVGTSQLLVRARATGTLPRLNEHVGEGWGTNGDVGLARTLTSLEVGTQGAPCASRILDEDGMPVTLENWFIPGATSSDIGILASLGLALDDTRGRFVYNPLSNAVELDWPANGNDAVLERTRAVNRKAAAASGAILPPIWEANATFTAHPLGGAVLGRATDGYGRVAGYRGLYVVDGAAVPGSTGTVNPSLTISALAERNVEAIIRAGE